MRNNSVTISKGIAIILMVIGHAGLPQSFNQYLVMIRMPLFFILSGYCFKERYLTDVGGFLKKRMKGIYLPYVKWSVFFLCIHNLLCYAHIESTESVWEMKDFLKHLLFIFTKMAGEDVLLGGFWFLKSLFWGSIIFFFVRKYIVNVELGGILMGVTVLSSYTGIHVPYWGVGPTDFFAAFYMMFGHYYKTMDLHWEKNLLFNLLALVLIVVGQDTGIPQ